MTADTNHLFAQACRHHDAGRWREAEELYRQVINANPGHADALHRLGLLAYQNDQFAAAAELVQRAIAVAGDRPVYYNTLGLAKAKQRLFDEAARSYERGLSLAPGMAELWNNLGSLLQSQSLWRRSIEAYRKATLIAPQDPTIRGNLAYSHMQLGETEEAERLFRGALFISPNDPELCNNLGILLHWRGDLHGAIDAFRRALKYAPMDARIHKNLAGILRELGHLDAALEEYNRAIQAKPDFYEAHTARGYALYEQRKYNLAVDAYKAAIEISPHHEEAWNNLGLVYEALGDYANAQRHFERAIEITPSSALGHNNLGNILKARGNFEGAMRCYRKAIEIDPQYARAAFSIAELKTFHPGDTDLAWLELAANANNATADAAYIHFALAKALDDTGDYDRAFEHYARGNALKRSSVRHDAAALETHFEQVIEVFTRDAIERWRRSFEGSKAKHIFIVGMPRSGSTLIEQILVSHPAVTSMGETDALDRALKETWEAVPPTPMIDYAGYLDTLTTSRLKSFTEHYDTQLGVRGRESNEGFVINKLPGNFLNVGLIHLAFPNAVIVHTARDPLDTCFSCFTKLFQEGQTFSYDQIDIARYFASYRRVMRHWSSVLPPGTLLEARYERFVDNLELEARRLIDHCRLSWNDRCLSFHQTERSIFTASAVQVRRPLYKGAVGRWKLYEKHLAPLKHALTDLAVLDDSTSAGV